MTTDALLTRIERYYDAVPRARSRVEEIGGLTLFVALSGWPYYARPRYARAAPATTPSVADIHAVVDRQRALGVPTSFEWTHEATPELRDTAEAAGLQVVVCPLLVLEGQPRGDAGMARLLDPDRAVDVAELASTRAAVGVGFANAGTEAGAPSYAERDAEQASQDPARLGGIRDSLRSGRLRQATVYAGDDRAAGPVGGGTYAAVDLVAEVTGVGVLPAFRRRGLAAALTCALATDALDSGIEVVFCSAQNDAVARVYERVGFRRIGSACIADPTAHP